jgi:5-methylcytosine-specific restriction endonuclease McrA
MTIPPATKAKVLDRDPFCVIAGEGCTRISVDADHRANGGNGGSKVLMDVRNLIGACRRCNSLKEDADGPIRAELIRRGVRVVQDSTNAKTLTRAINKLVQYPDGTWWFLMPDGTREEVEEPTF